MTFHLPHGPEKAVRNEQGRLIGHIQPGVDRHGNQCFVTRCAEGGGVLETMTEGAGRFWLWLQDERLGGARMR